jgi:hypothetical protein
MPSWTPPEWHWTAAYLAAFQPLPTALGGGAVDHRIAIDRFLEIFGDRAAIGDDDVLVLIGDHRGAPGGVQVEEHVRCCPRVFAKQIERNVLFAQQQPDLAAERAERELMELPHGGFPMPQFAGQIHALTPVMGEESDP